jgi:methionyl-tRNA formyltransferase
MQMEAGLDTGPMLLQLPTPISETDTSASLEERLAILGAEAMVSALEHLVTGSPSPTPQEESQVCYAAKLKKDEAPIDWTRPAEELHRKIRALNPWPVATTTWRGQVLRVWHVGPRSAESPRRTPGTVVAIEDGVNVQTGTGVLNLQQLQVPGGRALPARDFLNGTPIRVGDRLGD